MPDAATHSASVPVPHLPGESVIARWDATEVLLITNAAAPAARVLAEQLARRAMRDTPFPTPAFTTADTDPDTRILVARESGQAVGLAVLRPHPRWAWWSWDDWDEERRPSTGVAPLPAWTVELVWTDPAHQGRGLAWRILDVAATHVGAPISAFAWRRPFTPSGEAFVRRCCPEGFWVPE